MMCSFAVSFVLLLGSVHQTARRAGVSTGGCRAQKHERQEHAWKIRRDTKKPCETSGGIVEIDSAKPRNGDEEDEGRMASK